MAKWFKQLERNENGIQDEDIYNFDKTGFAMGMILTAKVITRAEILGKLQLLQPGNNEWVTAIKCISTTGFIVPPSIIFKGKRHIQGWYKEQGLPHN
jgi:hypothetical protein